MEPGWVVALCGAIGTLCAGAGTAFGSWLKYRKESHADEIVVLQNHIEKLDEDGERLRGEFDLYRKAKDADMKKLVDDHTACLVNQARQDEKIKGLESRLAELESGKNLTH